VLLSLRFVSLTKRIETLRFYATIFGVFQPSVVWLLQGVDLQSDGASSGHHQRLHATAWLPASAPGWLDALCCPPSGDTTSNGVPVCCNTSTSTDM